MNGCGMEAVSFSEAKDTSEQPDLLMNKELMIIAPNFFNLPANHSKPQTILSLQVTLKR